MIAFGPHSPPVLLNGLFWICYILQQWAFIYVGLYGYSYVEVSASFGSFRQSYRHPLFLLTTLPNHHRRVKMCFLSFAIEAGRLLFPTLWFNVS
jgi:hypothetical protein